jgi:hypothetical protein
MCTKNYETEIGGQCPVRSVELLKKKFTHGKIINKEKFRNFLRPLPVIINLKDLGRNYLGASLFFQVVKLRF